MGDVVPKTDFDARFSTPDAIATPWPVGRKQVEEAQTYWISTVRPDGRPHVTPMVGVWVDESLYFCTGPTERKAKNLESNSHVVVTTGSNDLDGLDVVIEGDAVRVTDTSRLQELADAYTAKYDETFHFTVRDDVFLSDGGEAYVFEVAPVRAFGFGGEGASYSQTRWRF